MSHERMQAAIQDLRDAVAVMDHIETRLPQVGKFKTESLAEIDEYRRRIDKNLAEINDKLKRLMEGRRGPNRSMGFYHSEYGVPSRLVLSEPLRTSKMPGSLWFTVLAASS